MGLATTATLPAGQIPPGSVRQLSDGNPNGTVLGTGPTDLISFYNTPPTPQPGSQGPNRGAIGNVVVYTSTQSPSAVTANTTAEKAMTVTGVAATDLVLVDKPTSQAGLAVGTARASATNTVQVTFANVTGATITPTASESYVITTVPAPFQLSVALTPIAVPANTTAEQQFVAAGLSVGMTVAVNKPTAQAGLMIVNTRVVSANVLGITYLNATAAPITPTAETYSYFGAFGIQPAAVMSELTPTLNPASVAANTTAEQTFTVTGLAAGTFVEVNKASVTPGLGLGGVRVSAANTLAITFINATAAAIDPPQEVYTVSYFPTAAPAAGSATTVASSPGSGATGAMIALGLIAA